jgi:alanine dehydrogenase
MEETETLLLTGGDVANLLSIDECMVAVENAFALHANGKMMPPKVLGIHVDNGGFHIKAGVLAADKIYFAAKTNANFPNNSIRYGLPTIQGVIVVCDGVNGRLLSLMDSIEITILRTGAATGIAAKYLSLPAASVVTICGCGNQGKISLKAIMAVRRIKKVYAFDIDPLQTEKFAREFSREINVVSITANELHDALVQSQICVTCTPSKDPFIHAEDIMPGTFIAAVGSDNEEKQELYPELVAANKIVVDIAEQAATIGELHHAIKQGLTTIENIHAELGQIITGQKAGRETDREIIIFDSTGTALQDVAAAAIVYEKALINKTGTTMNFSEK